MLGGRRLCHHRPRHLFILLKLHFGKELHRHKRRRQHACTNTISLPFYARNQRVVRRVFPKGAPPPGRANDWPGLTDSCALPLVCTCWLVGWLPLRVAVVARSRGRRSSAVVSTTPPSLARLTAGGPCATVASGPARERAPWRTRGVLNAHTHGWFDRKVFKRCLVELSRVESSQALHGS